MGALTLALTGAAGAVGRATLACARARGHRVHAVIRGEAPADWGADPGVSVFRADLAQEGAARPALDGADVVIHAAARLTGSEAEMMRDGPLATERLLRVNAAPGFRRPVVLVSSLAVLDGGSLTPGLTVTEAHPTERDPKARDAYARAKLGQEAVARDSGQPLAILRPGLVWGPGHLWNAHLGLRFGPVLLIPSAKGELPLIHVDNLALALVLAAETAAQGLAGPMLVHVLDDERPTRGAYVRAMGTPPLSVTGGYPLLDRLARAVAGRPGLPGLLRRPVLQSRLMELRYSNAALRAELDWQPVTGFAAGMAAARGTAR